MDDEEQTAQSGEGGNGMTQYINKRRVIEAVRFDGKNGAAIREWVEGDDTTRRFITKGASTTQTWNYLRGNADWSIYDAALWVQANETWVPIKRGEWVAKDDIGFYPITNEVFKMGYEDVCVDPECPQEEPHAAASHEGKKRVTQREEFIIHRDQETETETLVVETVEGRRTVYEVEDPADFDATVIMEDGDIALLCSAEDCDWEGWFSGDTEHITLSNLLGAYTSHITEAHPTSYVASDDEVDLEPPEDFFDPDDEEDEGESDLPLSDMTDEQLAAVLGGAVKEAAQASQSGVAQQAKKAAGRTNNRKA